MTNPYHDADGKFCSADEMNQSVINLIKKGNTDGALKLLTELRDIEAGSPVKKASPPTPKPPRGNAPMGEVRPPRRALSLASIGWLRRALDP